MATVLYSCFVLCASYHFASSQQCLVDIGVVIDSSSFISTSQWSLTTQFVSELSQSVTFSLDATRIGVVSFGDPSSLDVRLNQYNSPTDFGSNVRSLPKRNGVANLAEGIALATQQLFTTENGDRAAAPNILVLVLGGPVANIVEARAIAEDAKRAGILVYVLSIGSENPQASDLTSQPTQDFLSPLQTYESLPSSAQNIGSSICNLAVCASSDIAFILDSSGSIGTNNWNLMKEFVIAIVSQLNIGPQANLVGIVTYSTNGRLHIRLNDYTTQSELIDAINRLEHKDQRTNTAGGIRAAHSQLFTPQNGDRPDSPNVAIVVTDGQSNEEADQVQTESDSARSSSIRMMAVGVGTGANGDELSQVANKPSYFNEFLMKDYNDLLQQTVSIFESTCAVAVPSPFLDFSTCVADIAFVVDESTSVGFNNWETIVDFLVNMIGRITIGSDSNRVGVVKYSTDSTLSIRLNQYDNSEDLVQAVRGLSYNEGDTNTDMGILTMRTNLFSAQNGDREGVANVGIIITDGESANPEAASAEADRARQDGIILFAIGVAGANVDELNAIADKPSNEHVLFVDEYDILAPRLEAILAATCYSAAAVDWNCNFEDQESGSDFCSIIQDDNDQFDWILQEGRTPSDDTGPSGAQRGSYYLYMEGSNPRRQNDSARFYAPVEADTAGDYCLSFYRHMFGLHIGSLQVFQRRSDNSEKIRWTRRGNQGDVWKRHLLDLRMEQGDRVGFQGILARGYAGDIALDNIVITKGPCPTFPST